MRDPYLQAMGIEQWVRRKSHSQAAVDAEDKPVIAEHAVADGKDHAAEPVSQPETQSREIELAPTRSDQTHDIDRLDWPELKSRVVSCTLCDLHASRINAVFGSGDHHADWMLIGEAPGAEEDKQGEPFVGRAGELLTAMLQAMKLKREQVFITNIVKCRPPDNREPYVNEVQTCRPYLRRQIELLQPKLILAVGRVAAQNLLGRDEPMKDLRGQRFKYADTGIPVVVTYHPAYLLRTPTEKRKAWQDLQFAMRLLAEQAGTS